MKQVSIQEFQDMLNEKNWAIRTYTEEYDRFAVNSLEEDNYGDREEQEIVQVSGAGFVESALADIVLTYIEDYWFAENDPDSFEYGTEGQQTVWTLKNLEVIDEDGDVLDIHELNHLIPDCFSNTDYSEIQAGIETEETLGEISDSESVVRVKRYREPTLVFNGKVIMETSSSPQ